MDLFRRKSVTALQAEAEGDHSLARTLGPFALTMLGIGAIIGTGIFVLTGTVAAQNAGPAVVLSFVLAGIASVFAALCYSEFASLVPMAGSAYTYGYATLGEFIAWIIGWDLVLEYALSATTVAIGWSGYVVSFLGDLGIHVPPAFSNPPGLQVLLYPETNNWAAVSDPLLKCPTGRARGATAQPGCVIPDRGEVVAVTHVGVGGAGALRAAFDGGSGGWFTVVRADGGKVTNATTVPFDVQIVSEALTRDDEAQRFTIEQRR